MFFCGLDVGTSGVKAVVFDEKGNIIATSFYEYVLALKSDGTRELDPLDIWEKTKAVLHDVGTKCKDISALALSSFGEGFVCVDRAGREISRVMVFTDRRGEDEYFDAMKKSSNEEIAKICGLPPSTTYSISKLLHIKYNLQDVYKRTHKFLLIEDYIYFKLCGEAFTDYSLACRTMLFDVHKKQWSSVLMDKFGFDPERFATPVQSGSIVGGISAAVAQETGLPAGLKLVMGGHDQPVNAMGAGLREKSTVCSMGTSECLTPVFPSPLPYQVTLEASLSSEPFLVDDMYCTLAYNVTSGLAVKWFFDTFTPNERPDGHPPYAVFEKNAPKTPTRLMVQPYLMGSGTPYMDHRARFAVLGADVGTSRYDIYKAVLEGLCMDQRLNLEIIQNEGIPIDNIVCVGGGSRSDLWLSVKADSMQVAVSTLVCPEAGALGCAILCATAMGVYENAQSAGKEMSRIKKTIDPNPANAAPYDEKFALYKQLHRDLNSYSLYASK
jgi:xylulokinase